MSALDTKGMDMRVAHSYRNKEVVRFLDGHADPLVQELCARLSIEVDHEARLEEMDDNRRSEAARADNAQRETRELKSKLSDAQALATGFELAYLRLKTAWPAGVKMPEEPTPDASKAAGGAGKA